MDDLSVNMHKSVHDRSSIFDTMHEEQEKAAQRSLLQTPNTKYIQLMVVNDAVKEKAPSHRTPPSLPGGGGGQRR
jgi:hypothetical protein